MNIPDPSVADSVWTAGGVADDFRTLQVRRERRRSVIQTILAILVTIAVVGAPGWIACGNFQDARRQTLVEEFDSRRPAAQELPRRGNPAVKSLLQAADDLRSQAANGTVAALRQGLVKLAEAVNADRDLQRIRPVLTPLGVTLNETPWLNDAKIIDQRVKGLNQRHVEIKVLLEQGQIPAAEQALARLLGDVWNLQWDNVEAMRTAVSRHGWHRLKSSAPERLAKDAAWITILEVGKDAEHGWDQGDWVTARTLHSRADERAQQFLQKQLTPEERSRVLEAEADAIARLETELPDRMNQIKQLQEVKASLSEQLATTNSQRLTAEKQLAALSLESAKLKQDFSSASNELKELRSLKEQLAQRTIESNDARRRVEELTRSKATVDEQLAKVNGQLAAKVAEINALRMATAANSGKGENVVVQVSATLAGIESQLAEQIGGADAVSAANGARERLPDALRQYDRLVQEKETALAQKYLPTSQKVTGIEQTIRQVEHTMTTCLKSLVRPLAAQFEKLQAIIATAQSDYQSLLKEVRPDHPDAVKFRQRITSLEQEQQALAAANTRH